MVDDNYSEENIFIQPFSRDPKLNALTTEAFMQIIEISGLSNTHSPRYPVFLDFERDTRLPISLPLDEEQIIFCAQIDGGLCFHN